MRRVVTAGLVALLVVTAGCVGGIGGTPTAGDGASDGTGSGDGAATSESGTVNFYVSDQPNDMDDFEHLNVTVTTVRFHLVEENATAGTASETATAAPNETVTATATATESPNATTPTITAVEDETETEEAEDEEEREGDEESESDDESEDGRWVTREVNATTVDLTRLRGANATLVERFDLPAGEYDQVRLEVSETEGVLKDGSTTEVKLPSERLKLTQEFTVGDGEEVDFVYDVTVHKAGNSGKYVLRPVASESGTDVPIERVDGEGGGSGNGNGPPN